MLILGQVTWQGYGNLGANNYSGSRVGLTVGFCLEQN